MSNFKKNWWKILLLALIATFINIVDHAIDGTTLPTNIDPFSFFSKTIGTRTVITIFFIVFFSSISVTFLIIEKYLSGNKIIKGLKFGISWGIIFFLGAIETYPVFGKTSIIADIRLGLVDSISIIILGILLGKFFATDSQSSKTQTKNNSLILLVVTSFYIIGRYFEYSILKIESGFIERPVSTFLWTLGTGISFGILYILTGRDISGKNPIKKAVFFGSTNVGTNWIIFNLFWVLVYQSSTLRFVEFIVERAIVDTIFIMLGVYFSESLINKRNNYIHIFNKNINIFFKRIFLICLANPGLFMFYLKTFFIQRQAAEIRIRWEQSGVHIPPLLICSITKECNLNCAGCYSKILHDKHSVSQELSVKEWQRIFSEADALGISIILIAGGEPLIKPNFFELTRQFPKITFPVFTNGTTIDEKTISEFKKQKNVIPILSLEGLEKETDKRRGCGVFENVLSIAEKLKTNNIFFGISITATSQNFDLVTDNVFIKKLTNTGSRLFFFIQYVPIEEKSEYLILSDIQKSSIAEKIDNMEKHNKRAVFVSFPGEEKSYGGCLAAGRGFVHINACGEVEACPFAPFSDTNLKNITLAEALKSQLMKKIRDSHHMLVETNGGCALWQNREWIKKL